MLKLEANLHRGLLQAECADLRSRLSWLATAGKQWQAHRSKLAILGALSGVLAARHGKKLTSWIPLVTAGWRWLRRWAN
jgi:hypothetical protein